MTSLLLAVIYAAFISLGLPDSLLGSAWPVMHADLNVPLSYAGIVTMLVAGGTIVSSLLSEKLIRRLGTGVVTAVSVAATALALFGLSFSHSYLAVCLWSIPYGLGAGSVDAALNNFVALHYKSRHMNWLHCFWGVGASLGPYIMGQCLARQLNWNDGYRVIGYIQTALVMLLVFSLPLWKRKQERPIAQMKLTTSGGMRGALKLPGTMQTLVVFFCYCALETTTGLWASSYMVGSRGVNAQTAAMLASLFYLGITGGRFLSGWIAAKLSDRRMVRLGILFTALGIGLMLAPFGNTALYAGLVVLGLGCAPIYPSLLHETPENFGQAQSQTLMGMQMASAYTGSTIMPMVFGLIAQAVNLSLFPLYLLLFLVLMLIMSERATRIFASRAPAVPQDTAQL